MLNFRQHIAASLCVLSMLAASSCINDSEPCPDAPPSKSEPVAEVTLRLSVSAAGVGSRADHTNETDEPGTAPENYIDPDDLQMMLFHAGREFVQYLIPENITPNADGGYDMDVRIADYNFMKIVNGTPDEIRFYILVLANGQSMGAPWLNAYQTGLPDATGAIRDSGTTLQSLMADEQSTTMTVVPETYKLLEANKTNLTYAPQRMPMSGIQTFRVAPALLKATTPDNPYDLGEISLLRALAKIEVVDHINFIDNFTDAVKDSPDRIEKIELAGYVNKGNLLPAYAAWQSTANVNTFSTAQLTAPWLPANAVYNNPPLFNEDFNQITGWGSNDRLDFELSGHAANGSPIYSCYVYEYLLSQAVTQQPYLCVTLGDSRVYTMRLASYADGESTDASYLTELVRNHIYRYQINSVTDFKASLTLTVLDWELQQTTWHYSQNIGIAEGGEIRWTPDTYQSIAQNEARVILRQSGQPAQCTFTISSPLEAEWRAVFVPIGDTPSGAFKFRMADGSSVDEATGVIDGKQISLEIVPDNLTPPFQYSAYLQIIVTLADGSSMNADVLNGRYGANNKMFTVLQNPQL